MGGETVAASTGGRTPKGQGAGSRASRTQTPEPEYLRFFPVTNPRDGAMEDRNQTPPEKRPEADEPEKKPFEEPEVVSRGEIEIFGGSSYGP